MKNKGRRYAKPIPYAAVGKQAEKAAWRDFRRDPAFCQALSQELDVGTVPESYRKAMKTIYSELPRDMPVRHYPLRSALKGLATAAVLVVLAGASLFWANSVYPQMVESLPGLGMVFRSINQNDGNTPEAIGEEAQPLALVKKDRQRPTFTPVSADLKNGPGSFTVKDAWTNGQYLYLEVSAQVESSALTPPSYDAPQLLWPITETTNQMLLDWEVGQELYATITMDGQDLTGALVSRMQAVDGEWVTTEAPVLFPDRDLSTYTGATIDWPEVAPDGDTTELKGVWQARLPEGMAVGDSVHMAISLPAAVYEYAGPENTEATTTDALAFSMEFELEVDTVSCDGVNEDGQDNGVVVGSFSYTPVKSEAEIIVPQFGYYGYNMLLPQVSNYTPDAYTLYGSYAELSTEDGKVLAAQNLRPYLPNPVDEDGEEQSRYLAEFLTPPQDGIERLVLTLYQFDPRDFESLIGGFLGGDESLFYNPVVAEFTIDFETHTMTPSSHYAEKGLDKLDKETCLEAAGDIPVENGFLSRGISYSRYDMTGEEVILLAEAGVDTDNLAVQCYLGDELVRTVYSAPWEACVETDPSDTISSVYNSADGFFYMPNEAPHDSRPLTGYQELCFAVFYPEGMEVQDTALQDASHQSNFTHIQLVDTVTGQVLIDNVTDSYYNNMVCALTGATYKYYAAKKTADAEAKGVISQAEAQSAIEKAESSIIEKAIDEAEARSAIEEAESSMIENAMDEAEAQDATPPPSPKPPKESAPHESRS